MKARRLAIAAFLAAVSGALVAAFAPTGQVVEAYGSAAGAYTSRSYSVSMFQTNGAWVLVVVSVPVLLSLLPVLVPRRPAYLVSTVLLAAGCLAGAMSVGLFFLPAVILMAIATSRLPVPAA